MLKEPIVYNERIGQMKQFCEYFLIKQRIFDMTLDDFVHRYDRIKPSFNNETKTFSVYATAKQVDKKQKKIRKLIIYSGIKDKKKLYENERYELYKDTILFCSFVSVLKSVSEIDEEKNIIENVDSYVQELLTKGF